jgi:hypothetical protein
MAPRSPIRSMTPSGCRCDRGLRAAVPRPVEGAAGAVAPCQAAAPVVSGGPIALPVGP